MAAPSLIFIAFLVSVSLFGVSSASRVILPAEKNLTLSLQPNKNNITNSQSDQLYCDQPCCNQNCCADDDPFCRSPPYEPPPCDNPGCCEHCVPPYEPPPCNVPACYEPCRPSPPPPCLDGGIPIRNFTMD